METMLLPTSTDHKGQDVFRTISLTSLFTGTLDIVAANIYFYFKADHGAALKLTGTDEPVSFFTYLTHGGPGRIFSYIAKAVFDPTTHEKLLVAWGVVLHYTIAFLFTSFLFLIYPAVMKWLKNRHVIAIAYGLCIWAIMNLVVVPLTKLDSTPSDLKEAIIAGFIQTLMIGLPVAWAAHRFYSKKQAS